VIHTHAVAGDDHFVARLEARILRACDHARRIHAADAGKRRITLPAPVAARASL